MRASDLLYDLQKIFEGCAYKPYKDSGGVLTIGIGHANQDIEPFDENDVWDDAKIHEVWEKDIQHAIDLTNRWLDSDVSNVWYDAFVDLVFNTGAKPKTLLKCLAEGNEDKAREAYMQWIYCNGKALLGLIKRRLAWVAASEGYDPFEIANFNLSRSRLNEFNELIQPLGFRVESDDNKQYKVVRGVV